MSTKNKIFAGLVIIIVAVILILSWQAGSQNKNYAKEQNVTSTAVAAKNIAVNLLINGSPIAISDLVVKESSTVFQLLELANVKDPSINLQSKEYKDMGTLVEGIGNKTNGQDKKYWQYSVNGTQPMVGADKYVLQNNDKVEWFFKESSF